MLPFRIVAGGSWSLITAVQDVDGCRVYEVDDLLARDAGDRLIGVRLIGRRLLGRLALHVIARIRAAIKEGRHPNTTSRFKSCRFELYQKRPLTDRRTLVPF